MRPDVPSWRREHGRGEHLKVKFPSLNFDSSWRKTHPDSSYTSARIKRAGGKVEFRLVRFVGMFVPVILLLLLTAMTPAMSAESNRKIFFDIPQQRADLALVEFAKQADVTFIFPYDEARQKMTNRLVGYYSRNEAIDILLKGTGLEPEFNSQGNVMVRSSSKRTNGGKDMSAKNKGFIAGLLAALTAWGGAVHAQDSSAAGTTQAQQGQQGLEQIIVTATRRAENIQDISANVSAFTGQDLLASNITNSIQLQQHTLGLVFSTNGVYGQPYVRGVGSDVINPGTDSPIATYEDGAYQTRPTASIVDFFDVNRVEMLKGPQGALYGRNATGGVIKVISNIPEHAYDGQLSVSYGDYDNTQVRGMVNAPISDSFAVRLAGIYNYRSGFTKNTFNNTNIDGDHNFALRGSMLYEPNDSLKAVLIGEYIRETGNRAEAGKLITSPGLPDPVVDFAPAFGYVAPTIPSDPRVIQNDFQPTEFLIQKRLNLNVTYHLGLADLQWTSAYTDLTDDGKFDLDSTEVPYAYDREKSGSQAFAQSVQLSSSTSSKLHWIVGADYLHERATQTFDARLWSFLFPAGTPVLGPTSPVTGIVWQSSLHTNAWSVFGDVQYDVTDKVRLEVSGRYNSEEKRATFNRTYIDPTGILLGGAAQTPLGTIIPGLGTVIDPIAGDILFQLFPRRTFSQFTPTFSVEFRPTTDVLLYASATNGFKSGGFNLQNNGEEFAPEKIWSYEVGEKTSWLDDRLTANLSGFHYDYKDLQVERFDGLANNIGSADANIWGAEFEVHARPVPALQLDVGVSYLYAKYTKYLTINSNFPAMGIVDLKGFTMPKSPKFTVNLGAAYTWDLGENGSVTLGGDLHSFSSLYFDQFETAALKQGGYTLINARLNYKTAKGHWNVSLYGQNLTDKTYKQSMVRVDQFFGTLAFYGAPRTYGLQVGYKF